MKRCHIVLALAIAAPAVLAAGAASAQTARAEFVNRQGQPAGHADLTQSAHGTLIYLELRGLPPGPHGIHVHSVGTCDDREQGFQASRGHVNPETKQHGFMNAQGPDRGDLPNVFVHNDGTTKMEMFTPLLTLKGTNPPGMLDGDGAALVIHENRDDHMTQPIGGAGARIACGVVRAR